MDEKKAIDCLKNIIEYWTYKPTEVEATKLAIKALEKQVSFENEVNEIRDWFVNNKDCLYDSADKVAKEGFEALVGQYKLIDEIDLEAIIEDVVDEIQKGILNVLDTFKDN